VIAEALVLATRFEILVIPSAASGALFGLGTLVAYFMSRTTGLLGFEESSTTTEAVVAMVAEVVAVLSLTPVAIGALARRRAPAAVPA